MQINCTSHINFRFSDRRYSQSRTLNHNRAVLEIFHYWYCFFYVHGLYCANNRNSPAPTIIMLLKFWRSCW